MRYLINLFTRQGVYQSLYLIRDRKKRLFLIVIVLLLLLLVRNLFAQDVPIRDFSGKDIVYRIGDLGQLVEPNELYMAFFDQFYSNGQEKSGASIMTPYVITRLYPGGGDQDFFRGELSLDVNGPALCDEYRALIAPGLLSIWGQLGGGIGSSMQVTTHNYLINFAKKVSVQEMRQLTEGFVFRQFKVSYFRSSSMQTGPKDLYFQYFNDLSNGAVVPHVTWSRLARCSFVYDFIIPPGGAPKTVLGKNYTDSFGSLVFIFSVPVVAEYLSSEDPDPIFPIDSDPTCSGYEPGGDTFVKIFNDLKTNITQTDLGNAVVGVSTNLPVGVCPVWTLPAFMGVPGIDIDAQCQPLFTSYMFPITESMLLAVAAWTAVRWMFF